MPTDIGFFEAFYASPIQHPWLLWLAAALALGVVFTRRDLPRGMRRYCIALVVLSGLDAWLTTDEVFGLGRLEGWLASSVPLFFVLAGDFRYWLVVTSARRDAEMNADAGSIARALGLTLIVPVFTQVTMTLLPESLSGTRVMFLVYEVAFTLLTLLVMSTYGRLASSPWPRRVSRFVVLYYSLWATADIIILATGSDLGFALRVVPNVLYYGGLIAVMAICAADAQRRISQAR